MKMFRNRLVPGLAGLLAALTLGSPDAEATPAFARQMDMNCMSCHTQALTTLNSFGRHFKLSGYSMTSGNKSMITGGDLGTSVPLAINAGLGVKSNYVSYSNDTVARDDLSVPAGSAIIISGKIAENAGANTLWNGDGLIHVQTTFTKPIGTGRAGFSIYGAQGHGPFISTESYNTGLHKELGIFDNPGFTNAAQATGVGMGPASGVTLFYGGSGLTVAGGMWAKGYNTSYSNKGLDVDGTHSSLYRVAYDLPKMGAWEISVGAFGLNGSTSGTPCKLYENTGTPFSNCNTAIGGTPAWANSVSTIRTKANGYDMQVLGAIAGMQSQLALMHVANAESDFTNPVTDALLTGAPRVDAKATSLEARVMVKPMYGVSVGYMTFKNNLDSTKDFNTRTIGLLYNYADNVRFTVEQSAVDNDTASDYSVTMLQALLAF